MREVQRDTSVMSGHLNGIWSIPDIIIMPRSILIINLNIVCIGGKIKAIIGFVAIQFQVTIAGIQSCSQIHDGGGFGIYISVMQIQGCSVRGELFGREITGIIC